MGLKLYCMRFRKIQNRIIVEVRGNLVSIIIPVFNRAAIVGKTIESVLRQTYKNLEIIIIDDGSTDDSYMKCNEYAKEDARIILIK